MQHSQGNTPSKPENDLPKQPDLPSNNTPQKSDIPSPPPNIPKPDKALPPTPKQSEQKDASKAPGKDTDDSSSPPPNIPKPDTTNIPTPQKDASKTFESQTAQQTPKPHHEKNSVASNAPKPDKALPPAPKQSEQKASVKDTDDTPSPPPNTISLDRKSSSNTLLLSLIIIVAIILIVLIGIAVWMFAEQEDLDIEDIQAKPATVTDEQEEVASDPEDALTHTIITPPEEWESIPASTSDILATFQEPTSRMIDGKQVRATINVASEQLQETMTLEEYVAIAKEGLETTLKDYEIIDNAPVATVEGHDAHILGGTYMHDGIHMRNKILIVLAPDGSHVYAATGTANNDIWHEEAYDALFDAALTSLSIDEL